MGLPKQLSITLTRKWAQAKRLHRWCSGLPIDRQIGKGYKYQYHCTYCDKVIERWYGEEPISGAQHPYNYKLDKFKEDPVHNLSPPIIRID